VNVLLLFPLTPSPFSSVLSLSYKLRNSSLLVLSSFRAFQDALREALAHALVLLLVICFLLLLRPIDRRLVLRSASASPILGNITFSLLFFPILPLLLADHTIKEEQELR
jgi:hypothetical protein